MTDNRRFVPGVQAGAGGAVPGKAEGYISPLPAVTVPGMAYVPFQADIETYAPCRALERGTIFACLDKPFSGGNCK